MDKKNYLQKIGEVIARGSFKDNWESLSNFEPPKWMREKKFGIFIHWGPFSVPAYNDWYARNMYIQDMPEYEHHLKTYGAHKNFGYKDFIPMFTAENFDAKDWAALIKKTGAGYVVPVAEHHDGFQMYDSELSRWNAAKMGPRRDMLGELLEACDEMGIIRGASSHRLEHWFFFSNGKKFESDVNDSLTPDDLYWPAMPEAAHHDLFGEPAPDQEFLEDWLLRCCELVDKYRPQIFYFDWWIQHYAAKPFVKKFAAYYYNRAKEFGFEPAITYKHDAFAFGAAVVEIERGKFSGIQPFFWQTDTAVAKNSWCYSQNPVYKKTKTLVCDLVDIVSKNGALLLNFGPRPDGTIPD
ncbi:MAG: alpha-L-fucosidase, partial [Defluviitaleaceae bacterium]|nr:alpha-L-fucosidase [Defluviitaleaceae bacterium]